MKSNFTIRVNLPTGTFFTDRISQFRIKAIGGQILLLPHHAPIVSSFFQTACYIGDLEGNIVRAVANSGIFKFDNNVLDIYTDFFYFSNKKNEDIFQKVDAALQNIIDLSSKDSFHLDKKIVNDMKKRIYVLKSIYNEK